MRSPQLADDAVQVVLLARCRQASLVAGPLAQHFGLSATRAAALLEEGRGIIAAQMPLADVRKILPLFAALGLQVAVRPVDAAVGAEVYDLSLRCLSEASGRAALGALHRFGVARRATLASFATPSGLVVADLTETRAKAVAAELRAVPGVKVTVSAQSTAVYDLFLSRSAPSADLRRHLRLLGCLNAGPAKALATGLDRMTLAHVLSRFPQAGLFGVNQAFQRYELRLVGRGRLSSRELSDFLATRGVGAWQADPALARDGGTVLESGLSRAAAGQFLADYTAIGLRAEAELSLT
ncbi:hypothetical protein GC209_00760 [bacterium]|nr:hypothetical protein [bacterium]